MADLLSLALQHHQRGLLDQPAEMYWSILGLQPSGFTIAVTSGSGQSTGVLTAFPAPLVVTVTANNPSEPVAGGLVTFTPPASGASATLAGSPATIGADGTASVTATANGIVGSYAVTATASGITTPASFSLTNVPLIIALDPSAAGALSLSGNAGINTPGDCLRRFQLVELPCRPAATPRSRPRPSMSSAASRRAATPSLSPAPVTGAPVLAVASLPLPSTAGMTNYGSFSLGGNSSATIQPGIYSQISVSGNARLTMARGIYIIEGGGFSVSGNASVTGSGVMIVNAGSNYPGTGGTYGSITLGGNATYQPEPATSGPYAGIVFFQPMRQHEGPDRERQCLGNHRHDLRAGGRAFRERQRGAQCVSDRRYDSRSAATGSPTARARRVPPASAAAWCRLRRHRPRRPARSGLWRSSTRPRPPRSRSS